MRTALQHCMCEDAMMRVLSTSIQYIWNKIWYSNTTCTTEIFPYTGTLTHLVQSDCLHADGHVLNVSAECPLRFLAGAHIIPPPISNSLYTVSLVQLLHAQLPIWCYIGRPI